MTKENRKKAKCPINWTRLHAVDFCGIIALNYGQFALIFSLKGS